VNGIALPLLAKIVFPPTQNYRFDREQQLINEVVGQQ